MADDLILEATAGRELGTRPSRRSRRDGNVPAVVYGLGAEPTAVTVAWPDLRRAITTDAGLNALINLSVDGESQLTVVKDIQRHPVRRDVTHVDFLRIDAKAEISVDVPITLIGEAREVTQASGMVDQAMFTLTVNCKPDAIPNEIEVDISELTVGDSVRLADVALPAGVSTDVDGEEAVAVAMVTRSTLEAMAAEEAAEGEGDEGEGAGESAGDEGSDDDGGDADE